METIVKIESIKEDYPSKRKRINGAQLLTLLGNAKIRKQKLTKRHQTGEGYQIVTTKQIIKLVIDNDQQCCEDWGYFMSNDNLQDFIGANILSVSLTDAALNKAKLKERKVNPNDMFFEESTMFVNINTDKGLLQFVAYNNQNGYYRHWAKVECTQLNYSTYL